jgi:hypothetical protein
MQQAFKQLSHMGSSEPRYHVSYRSREVGELVVLWYCTIRYWRLSRDIRATLDATEPRVMRDIT